MVTSHTNPRRVEVYRFGLLASLLLPLIALFLQAFTPLRLHFLPIFDLPFLVVVYFAVVRRSQIAGLMTGAVVGLLQDSLTSKPIGLYGIANTIVGYGASSLGAKVNVENAGSRFLVIYGFYLLHEAIYFLVARFLVLETLSWSWQHELLSALANALLAVPAFAIMDRFKHPA
ncbi:MAG: rod shape-determining protein MreD [Acidobacteriales bacterium]|nr:rod shape-determining protein MreD [Terriglobales bacterium]